MNPRSFGAASVAFLAVVWMFKPALLSLAVIALLVVSFPVWFTALVTKLRMWIFTKINTTGHGVEFPNDDAYDRDVIKMYSNPAATGRSVGAELSDLFWYFLCPGPELHQEQVENGLLYDVLSAATAKMLASPAAAVEEMATRRTEEHFAKLLSKPDSWMTTRLRDFFFPLMTTVMYELIFGEQITPDALDLLKCTAENVVDAIKFTSFRNMKLRNKATDFLIKKLNDPETRLVAGEVFDPRLTVREQALHLQGAFFTTGCVQMSEALAHTALALAQHPDVCAKLHSLLLTDDEKATQYLNMVIDETFRMWPLFGIAHRITTADITSPNGMLYPAGSVLCFNYPKFHHSGFERPDDFLPERWLTTSKPKSNYMPFGVAANRPCPGQRISLLLTKAIMRVAVLRATFHSTAIHTRSLPCRGPSVIWARSSGFTSKGERLPLEKVIGSVDAQQRDVLSATKVATIRALLLALRLRDTWGNSIGGVTQMVVGSYMMWEHKRLLLCTGFFASPRACGRYNDLSLPGIGMTGETAPESVPLDVRSRSMSTARARSASDAIHQSVATRGRSNSSVDMIRKRSFSGAGHHCEIVSEMGFELPPRVPE